jgi:hypothetical protein
LISIYFLIRRVFEGLSLLLSLVSYSGRPKPRLTRKHIFWKLFGLRMPLCSEMLGCFIDLSLCRNVINLLAGAVLGKDEQSFAGVVDY